MECAYYGTCKICNKCDVNAYLKFHMCYECRKMLKCYYCEELLPNYIDCLNNYSCISCYDMKSCVNCYKKTIGKNDYCIQCEKSRGKCLQCKQSKILMNCGLCRGCEMEENLSLCQNKKPRNINDIVLQNKKNCLTCMKDKRFIYYLENKK